MLAGKAAAKTSDQMMEQVDAQGKKLLYPGKFSVIVAGSSPSERSKTLGVAASPEQVFKVK